MNPELLDLDQKVQKAEQLKQTIDGMQADQEQLKLQKIADYKQLVEEIDTLEKQLQLLSITFEEEKQQEFTALQDRIYILMAAKDELQALNQEIATTSTNQTTSPSPTPPPAKEKSSFWDFGKLFSKEERSDATGKNLWRIGAWLGIVWAAKRLWGKVSGSSEKKSESSEPWFIKRTLKKIGKRVMYGVWWLVVFSQRDNIRDLWRWLLGKENMTTDNAAITNKEKQTKQREKLDSKAKNNFTFLWEWIIDYHSSINPDFEKTQFSVHHQNKPWITPMLLDGLYKNIGDIHSVGSFTDEKRRERRERFNSTLWSLIGQKKKEVLNYLTPDQLKWFFGLNDTDITENWLSAQWWELVTQHRESAKDKLWYQQTQWFLQTKVYLSHVEGELAYQITKKALEDQNKTADKASILEALDDDVFQKEFVEDQMDKDFYDIWLWELGGLLQSKYSIDNSADTETIALVQEVLDAKEELMGDTFDTIVKPEDISQNKEALLVICTGALGVTKNKELREETNLWFSDVFWQLFSSEDALEDRIKDNLWGNILLDRYATEITALQTKIETGEATVEDIRSLEKVVQQLYQFQIDLKTGHNMSIDIKKRDGGEIVVNILEAWETLVEWTFREHNGVRDYALTWAWLGILGYTITHPRRVTWFTIKWVWRWLSHGVWITGSLAESVLRNKIRRMNYRMSSTPWLRRINFMRFRKNPEAMYEAFKRWYISLNDAATISARYAKNTWWNRWRKQKRVDSPLSDVVANNRSLFLKDVFTEKWTKIKLLNKHIDHKAWRELFFNRWMTGQRFLDIQNTLKSYDKLLSKWSLTPQSRKILETLVQTRKVWLSQLTSIIRSENITKLNALGQLDPKKTTKFIKALAKHGSVEKAQKVLAGKAIEQAPELTKLGKTLKYKADDLIKRAKTLWTWDQLWASYNRVAAQITEWSNKSLATMSIDQAKQFDTFFSKMSWDALSELFSYGWKQSDELLSVLIKFGNEDFLVLSSKVRAISWITVADDVLKQSALVRDIQAMHNNWTVKAIGKFVPEIIWFMKKLAKVF